MTEPDNKAEEDMSMEEALSAIRKLISEDDLPDDLGDDEDEDLTEELEALSERLAEAETAEDDSDEDDSDEDDADEDETDAEVDLAAEAVVEEAAFAEEEVEETELLELDAVDVEPLELDAVDVEPLDLADDAALVDAEDHLARSDTGDVSAPAAIEDIPKFLTELRQALGEVEKAAEEEVLPLSAEMELHREIPDERGQQQPAEEGEEAPPVIPDITEEKVAAPMNQGEDRILSPEAALKASSAFDNLSSLVTSGYEGEDNTLEGLVKSMMRPLLREWLDANLPRIVEEKVEAEIRKLSRSSGA